MKFPKLVIEEAQNLKKFATEQEINNLDFETLNHDNVEKCIYGQMTGHCFSARAKELIEKSCRRVYSTGGSFNDVKLNGAPIGRHRGADGKAYLFKSNTTYWSPIELFITKADVGQKLKLVSFIKGEIKSL